VHGRNGRGGSSITSSTSSSGKVGSLLGMEKEVVFLSKKQREAIKNKILPTVNNIARIEHKNGKNGGYNSNGDNGKSSFHHNSKFMSRDHPTRQQEQQQQSHHQLSTAELNAIKKAYLGETALQDEETIRLRQIEEQKRARQKKKITFKFKWDETEDTTSDGLLDALPTLEMGAGRRKKLKRDQEDGMERRTTGGRNGEDVLNNVMTKPLKDMTKRDWRILRENCDIAVRGGKAPPPLRTFRESSCAEVPAIHPALVDAIENVLKYKQPSPIQRQAIPIGLQRRDLIGVAETGSGKTAAFGIPLCHLILSLPKQVLDSVAENGPLALVMAPTRELAIQIDIEFKRLLSRQSNIQTSCIVGGQSIQQQAMELRNGVHIVVGTPGRINDCIENAYLVLNQCSYIVLDEADRMIDLGFAPQIESILESMGGLLKSEDEAEAYEQEVSDLNGIAYRVPKYRLTAMFSATMPAEVQRIAKQYLRHPAVVTIGGGESGSKNKRIHQTVMFLSSPSMKEKALKDVINKTRVSDKIIVFVNEKKNTDGVARMIERIGRRTVVLHGGKTQDQREENLEAFRRGGVILVATDVAGRGLDIPNIKHVINYDVPSRSIDSYCHRIGRTARAGAEGYATSFITDEDEGIMGPLKSYLESVGAHVPDRLAQHPAASSSVGGNIIF
jgi:Superfamily II DNA and RNA helicases